MSKVTDYLACIEWDITRTALWTGSGDICLDGSPGDASVSRFR